MSPARRKPSRRDWPRGLNMPRPGYYVWAHPDGRTLAIGRVDLATAINESIAANMHVAGQRPGLVEKLSGAAQTVADLLGRMKVSDVANTAKTHRSLDKMIAASLGSIQCGMLTVADCAEVVETMAAQGKARQAESIRSRLIAVCERGRRLGWMADNTASVTERPTVEVRRGRLSIDQFRAIHAKAGEVAEWLPMAMMLGLVTGADRSTIAGMQRADIAGGHLTLTRTKTGARIAIPLRLRMDAVGVTLGDLLKTRTGVVSRYVLHHVNPWGNAPAGSAVHPDRISHAFTAARKLAGIDDAAAPTFHELRSLAKRLYDAQGNVDTKALLGHKTERMGALYSDTRDDAPTMVSVG